MINLMIMRMIRNYTVWFRFGEFHPGDRAVLRAMRPPGLNPAE